VNLESRADASHSSGRTFGACRQPVRHLIAVVLLAAAAGCASRAGNPLATLDVSLHDARIIASVRSALLRDPALGLRAIAIDARDAVVTLSGTVWTADEVERATALARRAPGVRTVIASLTVDPRAPRDVRSGKHRQAGGSASGGARQHSSIDPQGQRNAIAVDVGAVAGRSVERHRRQAVAREREP
jgi:hypothetical protein